MRHFETRGLVRNSSIALIISWISLAVQVESILTTSIVLKARYRLSADHLQWSFPVLYGIPDQNLNQIFVRFDFHYARTIFISDEIYFNGVECSADFDCYFNPSLVYIFDPVGKRQLAAHYARIGMYFTPLEPKASSPFLVKLPFYLNNSDPSFIMGNIVGLQLNSDF